MVKESIFIRFCIQGSGILMCMCMMKRRPRRSFFGVRNLQDHPRLYSYLQELSDSPVDTLLRLSSDADTVVVFPVVAVVVEEGRKAANSQVSDVKVGAKEDLAREAMKSVRIGSCRYYPRTELSRAQKDVINLHSVTIFQKLFLNWTR